MSSPTLCKTTLTLPAIPLLLGAEMAKGEDPETLGARIARLPPGERVRGAHFCFLTRTPEADIAHARRQSRRLAVRLATWLRRAARRWDRWRHALYRL